MPQSNEYMLKQDDAELIYQKKLTAGTNITIDPITNTISATGSGGSSVSYAGSLPQGYGDTIGIITIDGTQYPIKVRNLIQGSNINIVQDMTTGNLTISSTAQGTHVEANPSDPATARLSTIEIGSIVYDIHSDNVIIGEQAPSSSQGENGDVYVKINTVETPTENHTCPYNINYTSGAVSNFSSNINVQAKIQGFWCRVYPSTLGWLYGTVWDRLTVGNLYRVSFNATFGDVPSVNASNELFGATIQSYNGAIDGDTITGGVAQDGEFAEYDDETYGKFFYQSMHEDAASGSYSFTFVADTELPICGIYIDKLNANNTLEISNWKLEEIELSYEIDKIYYKINGDWIEDTTGGTTYTAGTNIQISPQNVISATDTTYDVFEAPETAQDTGVNGLVPAPTYADVQANKVLQADGTWVPQSGGGGGGSGLPIFKEVTLYNAPDRTWRDITLADSLLNYDLVLFHVHDTTYNGSDTNHQHEGALVFTKQELIDCYNDTKVLWLMSYDDTYALYTLTDYQTLTATTHVTVFIQRITGIKFGTRNGDTTVLGSFIDTDRKLYEQSNVSSGTYSYTATEDCVVLAGLSRGGQYTIDGITVYYFDGSSLSQQTVLYLKKGQVLELIASQDYNWFTVYGVQGGDSQLIAPIIYSTTEREIGVWTDNKPLYQKTFEFNQQVITDNAWTTNILGTVGSGIEIVDFDGTFGLTGNPHFADFSYYRGSSEYFTAYVPNNNGHNDDIAVRPNMNAGVSVTLDKVTIWYTKDSDTAGSGAYNTLGTPMQHYSTTEEVIGTWIDGRTLYRRVYDFTSSPITVPTNTWLKVANDWQIQPIRGTVIITSTRAAYDVAVDCDDNDGLYVRSWLSYGNVNYLIVEYVKDSN